METRVPHHTLSAQLEDIRELLDKHRLVEQLTHTQESHRHELVESLTHRQNLAELRNRVSRLHTADIAYVLDNLPPDERGVVWQQVGHRRRGDVLVELSDGTRQQLVSTIPRDELMRTLDGLDADDLIYIADSLPEDVLQECLARFSAEERSFVTASISYPEDQVGHYMGPVSITVRDHDTLEAVVKQLRALKEMPSHADKLFVLDRRGVFKGVLPIPTVLLSDPQSHVVDVMATDVVTFHASDDVDDAAQAFERYDLVSAPVLTERGKLVGRLTVDTMMDYLRESNAEDMLRIAGLSAQEDLFVTIWKSARNRWLWLSINVLTAFVASRVIGLFEGSIEKLVALAALMPIVASVGGNTGNQTMSLVLRAITLGQVTAGNLFYLIRKELGISIVNGLLLGTIVALFAYAIYGNASLSVVIASAMLLNLIIAAAVGLAVPLTLEKMGRDPALGASVVITAATDSMGFFIFLGLATLFLI